MRDMLWILFMTGHLTTVQTNPPNYLQHCFKVMMAVVTLQSFAHTTDHGDAAASPRLFLPPSGPHLGLGCIILNCKAFGFVSVSTDSLISKW